MLHGTWYKGGVVDGVYLMADLPGMWNRGPRDFETSQFRMLDSRSNLDAFEFKSSVFIHIIEATFTDASKKMLQERFVNIIHQVDQFLKAPPSFQDRCVMLIIILIVI